MNWYGVSLCIKSKDYRALKEALRHETDPDRTLELACREVAIEEGHAGDPEAIKARARDLVERAQAGLRVVEARP